MNTSPLPFLQRSLSPSLQTAMVAPKLKHVPNAIMLETPFLFINIILMTFGLILNLFGIYCLRKQKKRQLLLQNLSVVNVAKVVYDVTSISLYHYQTTWYQKCHYIFDIVEVNILTVLFSSVILISIDRLACVLLGVHYKRFIKLSLIKDIIITTWLVGGTVGLFLWCLPVTTEYTKIYYYMTFDVVIIVCTIIVYTIVLVVLQKGSERFGQKKGARKNVNKKKAQKLQKRRYLVTSLIVSSFIVCNAIPDLVIANHFTVFTYHVTAFLWSLGTVVDPLIYIFLMKESRLVMFRIFECSPIHNVSKSTTL